MVILVKNLEMIAGWLLILGGLDLGLQGLMGYGLVYTLFGSEMFLGKLFNLAVGASAVWMAYSMVTAKKKR